ncbi:MAG: hypothetical protein OXI53_04920 [Nitrospira sp.]|nr:hypothetical protein [Nitrospira sp.]MDE0404634.1 hypothetical protein [Nitrospira sp.]MDE0485391.1 hypothetical protein [Nitrospira sp.]
MDTFQILTPGRMDVAGNEEPAMLVKTESSLSIHNEPSSYLKPRDGTGGAAFSSKRLGHHLSLYGKKPHDGFRAVLLCSQ